MATIASPGIGSGLDVSSIVTQLVSLERRPIEQLQTQASTIQAKLSSFGLPVFRESVSVQAGQTVNLAPEITPFGSIDIVSEPAGAVFVDGRQVGRTPLAGYPVTAGTIHRLEIRPSPADAGDAAWYRSSDAGDTDVSGFGDLRRTHVNVTSAVAVGF